ncbi:type II toxin-antitoxin system SpoIISA family toxin [Metabacillus sp. GX 13764]|uniref:type II toxin-antitoxin system SpoIISA family toxin n=1 Tax=Metabacillus kandeliae TaxID=2900151 RepID=UPI001E62D30B|nr:type II toxin-antitoxin system SpoIISA family toxin [Metabacillus kandeliae]MCD7035513.1 type II toxin-antitoxin system SpoIISA family toxin [Metabacillus kandeliae]
MFTELFLLAVLVFILLSLFFYIRYQVVYSMHLGLFRKSLYALFCIGIIIGSITHSIAFSDWQLLLKAAGFIVFIDLAIFQTPNIQKIGSAEFQHTDLIEKTITQNEKTISFMRRKSSVFSFLVQEGEWMTNEADPIASFKDYERQLTFIIQQYTSQFDFDFRIYELADTEEHTFDEGIIQILSSTENIYNIDIPNKEDVTENLAHAQTISFDEDKIVLIPIYSHYSYLIVLSANKGPIMEIDAIHLVNLVSMFDWKLPSPFDKSDTR